MAYFVDWIAKHVTIPVSDLTLVSGSNYTLNAADVHNELRRVEWAFDGGLWADPILKHYSTLVLSGIPKTRSVEMINDYTWGIDASNIVVSMLGIDHNLFDTFIPLNGVSILGNNSVGKQDIESGSGLSAEQDARLTAIDISTSYQNKIINNLKSVTKIGSSWYLIIFDDNNSTEILRKHLTDKDGNEISDLVAGVLSSEYKNSV